jgi:drug/metabolite transporter (DMT)-like permease
VDCYNYFFQGEKLAKLAILGLTISFSGVCVIFYDHLSDFLQPDFRFGILLSFIATISWALEVYTLRKKQLLSILILGLQMLISSLIFCRYWCNWN